MYNKEKLFIAGRSSYATGKPMLQTLPNFMNMFTKL